MSDQTEIPNTIFDQVKASPLIWFAGAFLMGILVGWQYPQHFLVWMILSFGVLLFAIIIKLIKRDALIAFLLIPGFVFFGAARFQLSQHLLPQNHISVFNDVEQHIYVTGTIGENPDIRDKVMNLKVDAISIDRGNGDEPVVGRVLVKLYNEYDLHYGDKVRVNGLLVTPPTSSDFSYKDYLLRQGITSMLSASNLTTLVGVQIDPMKALLISTQKAVYDRVEQLFMPPVASLIAGILIGRDQNIPDNVVNAFVKTGTSHIIAISGFNIGIISFVFILVFSSLFGKRTGTMISIVGIILYTLLAGAEPPLVRASIMGIIGAVGIVIGRRRSTLTALFFAAMVMALIDPQVLWEVGFQLSFAATLGIVTITQPLQELTRSWLARYISEVWLDKLVSILSDVLIITFAAQVTVLPLILYHFGKLPLITFITNPLILPLQPLLMILAGLSVLLSYIYFPLGQILALFTHPLGSATIAIVEILSKYSDLNISFGNFNLQFVILSFVFLLVVGIFWRKITESVKPGHWLVLLGLIAFLVFEAVAKLPDGNLHITVMDVGSADGILIETAAGKTILINGGETASQLLDQVGRRSSIFDRKVDVLVIASTQENQVAALPKFTSIFPPQKVIWSGNVEASYSSLKLHSALQQSSIELIDAAAGMTLDLGNGASLRFISTSSRGAILLLTDGAFSMLLPIGINRAEMEDLGYGDKLTAATAYYFAESGYEPANPIQMINKVHPDFFVLSVSGMDTRGYPTRSLMDAIKNPNILRTDHSGWIEIITNGLTYRIVTQR